MEVEEALGKHVDPSSMLTQARVGQNNVARLPLAQFLARVGVDPDVGLSDEDVARRRIRFFGDRSSFTYHQESWLQEYRRMSQRMPSVLGPATLAAASLLVLLLVLVVRDATIWSGLISSLFWLSLLFLAFLVLRSLAAAAVIILLRNRSVPRIGESPVRVLRNRVVSVVRVRDLVPGDVILVSMGDVVPVDARIVQSSHLAVDMAMLTGEAGSQARHVSDGAITEHPMESPFLLISQSHVVRGSARAVVFAVGDDSLAGLLMSLTTWTGSTVDDVLFEHLRIAARRVFLASLVLPVLVIIHLLAVGVSATWPMPRSIWLFSLSAVVASAPFLPLAVLACAWAVRLAAAQDVRIRNWEVLSSLPDIRCVVLHDNALKLENEVVATRVLLHNQLWTCSSAAWGAPTPATKPSPALSTAPAAARARLALALTAAYAPCSNTPPITSHRVVHGRLLDQGMQRLLASPDLAACVMARPPVMRQHVPYQASSKVSVGVCDVPCDADIPVAVGIHGEMDGGGGGGGAAAAAVAVVPRGQQLTVIVGSLHAVLWHCSSEYDEHGRLRSVDESRRGEIASQAAEFHENGEWVIAIAVRHVKLPCDGEAGSTCQVAENANACLSSRNADSILHAAEKADACLPAEDAEDVAQAEMKNTDFHLVALVLFAPPLRPDINDTIRTLADPTSECASRLILASETGATALRSLAYRCGLVTLPDQLRFFGGAEDVTDVIDPARPSAVALPAYVVRNHANLLPPLTARYSHFAVCRADAAAIRSLLNLICDAPSPRLWFSADTHVSVGNAFGAPYDGVSIGLGLSRLGAAAAHADIILQHDRLCGVQLVFRLASLLRQHLARALSVSLSARASILTLALVAIVLTLPVPLSVPAMFTLVIVADLAAAAVLLFQPDSSVEQPGFRPHLAIVSRKLVTHSFFVSGVINAAAAVFAYFAVYADYGVHPSLLVRAGDAIVHDNLINAAVQRVLQRQADPLISGTGDVAAAASTAAFFALALMSVTNALLAYAPRSALVGDGSRLLPPAPITAALTMCLAGVAAIVYLPGVNSLVQLTPIHPRHCLLAVPFVMFTLGLDLVRRVLVQRRPDVRLVRQIF